MGRDCADDVQAGHSILPDGRYVGGLGACMARDDREGITQGEGGLGTQAETSDLLIGVALRALSEGGKDADHLIFGQTWAVVSDGERGVEL